METKEVLKGLGLQTYEAEVYEALLRLKLARVKDLTRVVSVPRAQIYAALKTLMDKGMCVEVRGKFTSYSPAAPSVAFKTILKREEDNLKVKIDCIRRLDEEHQQTGIGNVPVNSLQVLKGRQVKNFIDDNAADTRREMLTFLKSAAGQSTKSLEGATRLEVGLMERGVHVRCLYDESCLADENVVVYIKRLVAAGEDARVLPSVPMNLTIFDDRAALFSLDAPGGDLTVFAFTHPDVIKVLRASFDHHWNQGRKLKEALRTGKGKGSTSTSSVKPKVENDRVVLRVANAV